MKSRVAKLAFTLAIQISFLMGGWCPVAQGSYYNFRCPSETEIQFYDRIDSTWYEGLHTVPVGPTVVRFQSPGGLIEDEEIALGELRLLANRVFLKSGQKLKVIVGETCASACTIFLAGLNQLAGQGQIELFIDKGLQLGFHAGVLADSRSIFPPTSLFAFYSKYEVSLSWLNQNQNIFSTTSLKWVSPLDSWLAKSQMLSHSILVDDEIGGMPIPSSSDCTPGPHKE